jgi:hypothetical protein
MWKRVYELGESTSSNRPIHLLCNAHVENDRRRVVLSSIVRIFNNTTLPLMLLNVDPTQPTKCTRVIRIEVNQDYYVPIDVLYEHSEPSVFLTIDE